MLYNISDDVQDTISLVQSALRKTNWDVWVRHSRKCSLKSQLQAAAAPVKALQEPFLPRNAEDNRRCFKLGFTQQQQSRGSSTETSSWRINKSVVFNTQRQRRSRMRWQHKKYKEHHMPHRKRTHLQMNRDALPRFLRQKSQSRNSVRDQMAGGSMLTCFQSLLEAPR